MMTAETSVADKKIEGVVVEAWSKGTSAHVDDPGRGRKREHTQSIRHTC